VAAQIPCSVFPDPAAINVEGEFGRALNEDHDRIHPANLPDSGNPHAIKCSNVNWFTPSPGFFS
jgi:hypothetical protein